MTMRFTQMITHWRPDDALAIIQFLDQLRDALWATYGDEIMQQHHEELNFKSDKTEFVEIDDEIPF